MVRSIRGSEDAHPEPAEDRAHPADGHHRVHEPPLDHAIDEGPSNPTAHQPGPEGGQGEVGGRQGGDDQCLGHDAGRLRADQDKKD